jgi:hypothetical protein
MNRKTMFTLGVLSTLCLIVAGCNGGGGKSLTEQERGVVWQQLKAIEPIAAVHKGEEKLVDATDKVLGAFKRATGHEIATVERRALQDILDAQALQELEVFGGSSAARETALTKAKGLLVSTCSARDENRNTTRLDEKWIITGSVRITNLATGDVIYESPTISAGGKKTLNDSIHEYVKEMESRLRRDFGN